MDNVIIRFEESGLDNILDGLVKLGTVDAKEAEQFKASNTAFKEKQQLVTAAIATQTKLSSETSKATKSMDDLAKASANAAKNIVNGATNEAIKGTTTLIDKQTESTKKYDESLKGLKQQYKDFVAEAIKAGSFTPIGQDFLAQAGKVKLEIAEITQATKEYGSQTSTFNAITEGLRGIGAGYEVAQGAQALFGEGNKNLEEQLVKIQGTMALVNGLTEIQRALLKDSAVVLGAQNVLKKLGVTITTESNVAEGTGVVTKTRAITVQAIENGLTSTSIVVRTAATAAQWLLNAAMYAFPLIAIIAGLAAIVGLFGGFSDGTKEATKAQIDLTKAELDELEVLKATQDYLNSISKSRQEQIQRDIDLLKTKNASTDEIRKKESDLASEQLRNAKANFNLHYDEIQALKLNQQELVGLTAKLAGLNKAKQENDSKEFDKDIEATTSKLELMTKQVANAEGALKDLKDANAKAQELGIKNKKDDTNEQLAVAKDVIDAKLRFAKQGSEEELALNIAAAKNEYDTKIINLKAANESTADIEATYREKIQQLNIAFNNKILQDDIALNNAKLIAVQKGSESELDLKLKNLENQNTIDLSNTKISNDAKKALTAKYLNEVNLMIQDFNQKKKENELNTEILKNDALLQAEEKGSSNIFLLKAKQLSLNEQLEIASISKDIAGTELGEAKKNDIIAKYAAQKKQLEIETWDAIVKHREKELLDEDAFYKQLSQIQINSVKTQFAEKQQLQLAQFDIQRKDLDAELNAIEGQRNIGKLTEQEYQDAILAMKRKYRVLDLQEQDAKDKAEQELMKHNMEVIASNANSILDVLTKANDAYLANQLDGFKTEQDANQASYDQGIITKKAYEAKKKEIDDKANREKTKAAERAKEIALAQIVIKTAQAVVTALADYNYAQAVIAGVVGAAEFAIAAAQPIPQYYKGTENAPKGWAWVGEKGPELMQVPAGAKIRTHEKSIEMARKNSTPSLRSSFYATVDRSPIPSDLAKEAMTSFTKQGMHIDYDLLGEVFGKQISKVPLTLMSFDRQGFSMSIQEGQTTNKYLDSRYPS